MIAEAIERIRQLSRDALTPQTLYPGVEPKHVYYLYDPHTGTLERRWAEPHPRAHRLHTLDSFIEAVQNYGAERVAVFCGRGDLVAVLDDGGDRRDMVRMELRKAEQFLTLERLRDEHDEMTQREFVSRLRVDLAGALVDPLIVNTFRHLKFSKLDDGQHKLDHGKEALSREIHQEMVADGVPIPEELWCALCVYRDLVEPADDLRKTVRCAIELNLLDASFTLIPLAGELETAERETDEWIAGRLRRELDEKCEIFCGAP